MPARGEYPGLALLNLERPRAESQALNSQETAVLEAIHALFVAGVSRIRVEQVRALASSGLGADLAIPTVSEALERLRSSSFIREGATIVPEEAILSELVGDDHRVCRGHGRVPEEQRSDRDEIVHPVVRKGDRRQAREGDD